MILDYINQTTRRSNVKIKWVLKHLSLPVNTYYRWRRLELIGELSDKYKVHRNIDAILGWEIKSVIKYALAHPEAGYRRLCYMMIDADIVYLSPSSVYRILSERDLLERYKKSSKSKGKYDYKPDAPHQQWHTDIMYLWVNGRWYFFIGFIDAYSRYIVHWELLETASSLDVTAALESALKKYPGKTPRIVQDNGPQFKSREFRALLKEKMLKDIKIRIHHPESNGKIERFHRSLREEALSEQTLSDKYKAEEIISKWIGYYNHERLHASLNYLRPIDYFLERSVELLEIRREKISKASEDRRAENIRIMNQSNVKEQKSGALPPYPQDLSQKAVPA
jgi:transposase InsO family protein